MPDNYVFQAKTHFLEMAHTNFVSSVRAYQPLIKIKKNENHGFQTSETSNFSIRSNNVVFVKFIDSFLFLYFVWLIYILYILYSLYIEEALEAVGGNFDQAIDVLSGAVVGGIGSGAARDDSEAIAKLVAMGFAKDKAKETLAAVGGDLDGAVGILLNQ